MIISRLDTQELSACKSPVVVHKHGQSTPAPETAIPEIDDAKTE